MGSSKKQDAWMKRQRPCNETHLLLPARKAGMDKRQPYPKAPFSQEAPRPRRLPRLVSFLHRYRRVRYVFQN
jgi:hypothetical protein